jgi:hypothetical protein
MAGYPDGKDALNSKTGYLFVTLRDTLDEIDRINSKLAAIPGAENPQTDTLGSVGYTTAEAATVRAAYQQGAKLRRVANNADTVATTDDFFFHARNLVGWD